MTTFLLGAGFNVDAWAEAACQRRLSPECGYPLLGDLLRKCFNLTETPPGKSIEDLFSEAQECRNDAPIRELASTLMVADRCTAYALADAEKATCYWKFLERFPESHFLTFNYDSLVETLLFKMGRWYPGDGYGMEVVAPLLAYQPVAQAFVGRVSSTFVLHLHGTLCVRTSEHETQRQPGAEVAELRERDRPEYTFDPLGINGNFPPFTRTAGDNYPQDRIIAPIRDKSEGLRLKFIDATYAKAVEVVRASDAVVAIGYSFNTHDFQSYQPLLRACSQSKCRNLVVVTPDADAVAGRVGEMSPGISIAPVKSSFRQWVLNSFPGL